MAVLSHSAALVHRRDKDRYLTTLVAPAPRREALFSLLAFNLEIAAIPEAVSEPILGEIRLQWWRDTLNSVYDGTGVGHPVAQGLACGVGKHNLTKSLFDEYLDTRAFDLLSETPASLETLENYANGTTGALNELMAEVMGLPELDPARQVSVRAAVRHAGVAWGLSGVLDAIAFHARRGRSYLPENLTSDEAVRAIAGRARRRIKAARDLAASVPKGMLTVMLTAYLADDLLRRIKNSGFDLHRFHSQRPGISRLFRFYGKVLRRSY